MSLNQTPIANRLHIGIFGRRNVGKSSFINALTNQYIAIVSDVPGTTTDPVYKTIEILPEPGPCVIIDTAGLDDEGNLGALRREKSHQILNKTDLAIVLIDPMIGIEEFEKDLIQTIDEKKIPLLIVSNKIDVTPKDIQVTEFINPFPLFKVSSKTGTGIDELRSNLSKYAPSKIEDMSVVKGIVKRGDTVVLVIPIDSAMPKGRLILPEVQVLRAVLDEDAHAVVCKEYELEHALNQLKNGPELVVTDSQVYHIVKDIVPEQIRLTSFSMLFARYKGDFGEYVEGANAIDALVPGDKVLIAEACTHHPQPQDIGRYKIPKLLDAKAGGALHYTTYSGADFPEDLSAYKLIIMCGSCMINTKNVMFRIELARSAGIPVTNYGVFFAKMNGILDRTSWLLDYPMSRITKHNPTVLSH
ncbi:MAG: [FeFe] hydrogenase H-cluster maturation GTPase HydF [Candidatus Margulisiibacteriota bacterium]|nr:MAG: [FeFe] hydrogenase H-cluster maturation GTPase HydF [Candidatus Margulisbacteria bacterium GWD2_39_127]OGI01812.1 MAG: [FeFe] hydrogenase H-cluster maturation GTPase HydF [Candidatus Margulisbacteria bacterium GWF2_38_17]OGI10134.1 MAG: [FeFe] hydrogenase H-cluster maturation GTPase HydF [Candidatus Margulisbacteria bacterium GWE2_39_32]PZM79529.1 MAG: [FeFe] hydrogenase H-cluster maturation GTPase HydF [Candidatus Margulisiibacteriota bacterium]HAR63798.1 [FeFe] hydrogenase H-cluster m